MQVPAAGGVATPVTTVSGRNEVHVFPTFLPDGKHFIYMRAPDNPGIYIGSLDLKPEQQSSRLVLATPVMAVYTPPARAGMGRLLFVRAGSLLTQPFDERRLVPAGEPVVVTRRVATYLLSGNFSASSNGVLTYRTAEAGVGLSVLNWFDRKGKKLGAVGEAGSYHYFDLGLSPDATRVAATRVSGMSLGESIGMWLFDLDRGVGARLTFDPAPDSSPVWSPDGKRIAFAAVRAGGTGIYQKASNGTPSEQALVSPTAELKVADDWSRDGHFLMYAKQDPATNTDLWIVPLTSDGTPGGPGAPFADTKFIEDQGQFAPDTHWVAYVSHESGRLEVYIRPFPTPAGGGSKIQVSRGGGMQPRWRRDGRELFYLSLDGNMMAVDVTLGPVLKAGVPESLFQVSVARNGRESPVDAFAWDVTADGKRFLINTAEKVSQPVTVVLNWDAELPKR